LSAFSESDLRDDVLFSVVSESDLLEDVADSDPWDLEGETMLADSKASSSSHSGAGLRKLDGTSPRTPLSSPEKKPSSSISPTM
jgi:hypothetical protein